APKSILWRALFEHVQIAASADLAAPRAPGMLELSADAEREVARAADLARRPRDGVRVGEAEVRDAFHPDLERDPQLHPRQVRPDAAVDAESERGVPVDLAVDDDLGGPVELGGV